MKIITDLLIKIIPSNWYTAKKTCDIITKLCDTVIELKWFIFPTLLTLAITLGVVFVWFFKWKIEKLKIKNKE
jgi:hypothetical protein